MQDKIILGLLIEQPYTSYSIKKAMEQSVDFFYSCSLGSIHPCLKKLEKNGFCESKEILSGKRKSFEYHITKSGELEFKKWLSCSIEMGRIKEDALVKLFFIGHLKTEQILIIIDEYIAKLDESLDALKMLDQLNQQKIKSITLTSVQKLRLETLRFGIDYMQFARKWYVNLKSRV
ncbi:PadR family transcriptional regulator [Marinicellulosiphila megalodicopiae]|uniref:PadR family transcriptional regulator n=1 Tax=Marinicellulosiphila megalodicopiae TaxID=2724896 RepID=UPI003BAE9B64